MNVSNSATCQRADQYGFGIADLLCEFLYFLAVGLNIHTGGSGSLPLVFMM